jgi:hypothetical protein
VSTFGGVDSNTVRPFNQSFIWSPQVSILWTTIPAEKFSDTIFYYN